MLVHLQLKISMSKGATNYSIETRWNELCSSSSISGLKKLIPNMLVQLLSDLPGWSVDLKIGGPSGDETEIEYLQ